MGFANGHTENPTYKEVYTDQTGFAETVFVRFYPDVVSLEFLLKMFFKAIDPTSLNKQGHDEGTRSVSYTQSYWCLLYQPGRFARHREGVCRGTEEPQSAISSRENALAELLYSRGVSSGLSRQKS